MRKSGLVVAFLLGLMIPSLRPLPWPGPGDTAHAITCTSINGTAGDDIIEGTSGCDHIWGWAGRDHLYGQGGDDEIRGGSWGDTIWGESGSDSMWGDDGEDVVYGGGGQDLVRGGERDDILLGHAGNDTVVDGQTGDADSLCGHDGADHLDAYDGDGQDTLWPKPGPGDTINKNQYDVVYNSECGTIP